MSRKQQTSEEAQEALLEKRRKSLKEISTSDNSPLVVDFPPPVSVPVIVHCEEFSCAGFIDKKGIWRSRFTNRPIEARVIGWMPLAGH